MKKRDCAVKILDSGTQTRFDVNYSEKCVCWGGSRAGRTRAVYGPCPCVRPDVFGRVALLLRQNSVSVKCLPVGDGGKP